MSSRTPTECVDVATDSSASDEARREGIHALKQANECDELAALVRNEDLEERFRREALEALETPQCDTTLTQLVEEDSLNQELHNKASDLLRQQDDD